MFHVKQFDGAVPRLPGVSPWRQNVSRETFWTVAAIHLLFSPSRSSPSASQLATTPPGNRIRPFAREGRSTQSSGNETNVSRETIGGGFVPRAFGPKKLYVRPSSSSQEQFCGSAPRRNKMFHVKHVARWKAVLLHFAGLVSRRNWLELSPLRTRRAAWERQPQPSIWVPLSPPLRSKRLSSTATPRQIPRVRSDFLRIRRVGRSTRR